MFTDSHWLHCLMAVFGLLLLVLLSACSLTPDAAPMTLSTGWSLQDAAKIQAAPEAISQPAFAPAGWYQATVPGTVLTSLVNAGVYPEPLYGENNRPDKIPESLARTSYWYRTQFTVPARYSGRHIWLNFAGINYIAEVWVNGHNAGTIKGAFARGIFDISPFVQTGDQAAVAVHIIPPPHPGNTHEKTQAAGTGPNGGELSRDGPTFLASIGWDWIPTIRDRNIGIWQNVTLSATGPVVLEDPTVSSDLPLPKTDFADLTVIATLRNVTDLPQTGALKGTFDGVTFETSFQLAARESRTLKLTPATTPQLHLAHPRLWWPNTYGRPDLYAMNLRVELDHVLSDSREFNFGIRKITYQVPTSQNLTVSVNGVPVICKGGNWGMDEAMKRIPRERLEAQIRMHQLANYTMIRNWVGQSTSEDFYDLCDRYGIMIWDEMFQPNASDGPRPLNPDVDLYLANVREKVLRFRSHPSIALWCGRNESNPEPAAVAQGIAKITSELDPARFYQPNSADGRGVRSGGPYSWRTPREFYAGPRNGPLEPFKTELGSVSIPTLEAVQAMMPEKDWETVNDDWAQHDMARGAQEGRGGPLYADMIDQRYGLCPDLADFVRKSQLANYEAYRAMYEGRFAKLFNPVTGVLTWMSNPAQPSFVWQLYSHDLEPNASLFAVRKACEPLHIQMNQSDFHLMVINSTAAAVEGLQAMVRIFNLDGTLKYQHQTPLSAPPSMATDAGVIDFPADLSPVHFIKVELRDNGNHLLSDNFYWRALPDRQDDFTPLAGLPTIKLQMTVVRHDAGGKCLLDVTLANPTQSIALMAHLQLRNGFTGDRVLPVYYSDNYISLLPGESRTVSIEAGAESLNYAAPSVHLDGFNITTQ